MVASLSVRRMAIAAVSFFLFAQPRSISSSEIVINKPLPNTMENTPVNPQERPYKTEIYQRKKRHSKAQSGRDFFKFAKHMWNVMFGGDSSQPSQRSSKQQQRMRDRQHRKEEYRREHRKEEVSHQLDSLDELLANPSPDEASENVFYLSSKQAALQHVEKHLGHHRRRRRRSPRRGGLKSEL